MEYRKNGGSIECLHIDPRSVGRVTYVLTGTDRDFHGDAEHTERMCIVQLLAQRVEPRDKDRCDVRCTTGDCFDNVNVHSLGGFASYLGMIERFDLDAHLTEECARRAACDAVSD